MGYFFFEYLYVLHIRQKQVLVTYFLSALISSRFFFFFLRYAWFIVLYKPRSLRNVQPKPICRKEVELQRRNIVTNYAKQFLSRAVARDHPLIAAKCSHDACRLNYANDSTHICHERSENVSFNHGISYNSSYNFTVGLLIKRLCARF